MNTNPLIAEMKLPGQTVKLPSAGLFYKNGELSDSVKNGEVHLYPITAYHEILLKSPDFLLSGTAVERVFRDCIPDIIKPLDLITKDVDFLFVCLRKITFGDEIEFEYTHHCDDAKKHRYVTNVSSLLNKTVRLDPTLVDDTFSIKLDNNYVINIHPLRFRDFITLNDAPNNSMNTPEDQFTYVVNSLLSTISSVVTPSGMEVSDKDLIKEWLIPLGSNYFRHITSKINDSAKWGPIFEATCKCQDCNEDFPVDIPVNPVLVFF